MGKSDYKMWKALLKIMKEQNVWIPPSFFCIFLVCDFVILWKPAILQWLLFSALGIRICYLEANSPQILDGIKKMKNICMNHCYIILNIHCTITCTKLLYFSDIGICCIYYEHSLPLIMANGWLMGDLVLSRMKNEMNELRNTHNVKTLVVHHTCFKNKQILYLLS